MDSDLSCLLHWNLLEAILTGQILCDIFSAGTKVSWMLSVFNSLYTNTILGSGPTLFKTKKWDSGVKFNDKANIVLE